MLEIFSVLLKIFHCLPKQNRVGRTEGMSHSGKEKKLLSPFNGPFPALLNTEFHDLSDQRYWQGLFQRKLNRTLRRFKIFKILRKNFYSRWHRIKNRYVFCMRQRSQESFDMNRPAYSTLMPRWRQAQQFLLFHAISIIFPAPRVQPNRYNPQLFSVSLSQIKNLKSQMKNQAGIISSYWHSK